MFHKYISILLILSWYANATEILNSRQAKIVNGDEVKPHSLPYMVAIEATINYKTIRCGGSLITTQSVLTAARCVDGADKINLILGGHDLSVVEDSQIKLISDDVSIHDAWNGTHNDIAIVRLPSAITLSENVGLLGLPKDTSEDFSEKLGLIAGWGRVNDTATEYSNVLRKIDVVIIPTIICDLSYVFTLDFTQLCTSGSGLLNTCRGDSGSPLVADGVQAGIVSYGSDFGCNTGFPTVHTRITSYMEWISENAK